jgi:ring-1,2-phenylacetyl-CoA epoxidase subunit PaaE
MKLIPLKVEKIERQTNDAVTIEFSTPLEQNSSFNFKSGQYLSLESIIDDENVRRSYSICTAPHEEALKVCVKAIKDGKFSQFANNVLKSGDEIKVLPPTGNFIIKDLQESGSYVFFAAGSGITPIISQIKDVLFNTSKTEVVLFYGNKNTESIIFREELEALKNIYLDRISIHYVLSKEMPSNALYSGRINGEKCEKFAKYFFNIEQTNGVYLCGPASMIFDVEETLLKLGFAKNKIKYELFTTADMPIVQKTEEVSDFDPTKESRVSVTVDGLKINFTLPFGGDNILDGALDQGADLPYSCKGGVCSTCKAKLIKGKINMDVNYALEPDEVEAGYILACQSHPRTEEVEVDFDV